MKKIGVTRAPNSYVPPRRRGGVKGQRKYPFKSMKPGDSFLVYAPTAAEAERTQKAIYVAVGRARKAKEISPCYRIAVRRVETGLRVWREEDESLF